MTRTVLDDLGHPTRLPSGPARRIVSLVPNVSELLARWGLGAALVGVTEWCVEPPDGFPAAVRIRGTKNPDLAAIEAAAPDLVVANEEENRQLDVARLRAAGIAVHVTRVRRVGELVASLARLADALGDPALAATVQAPLRAALGTLPSRDGRRARRTACAVWRDGTDGEDGWWLLGRDTYGADLLDHAGAELVPTDPDGRYPRSTLGALVALAPELVLLPDEPYAFGARDVEDLARVGLTGRLVDGRALWWWGPRTPAALHHLATVVQP